MSPLRCYVTVPTLGLLFVVVSSLALSMPVRRSLPDKILVGYASKCTNGRVRKAVSEGVNVVVWAFAEFASPDIKTNLDIHCIRKEIQFLDDAGYDDTVHLLGFGGWNGPHLDPSYSCEALYQSFQELGGEIFHGIDWDFEGNDDLNSTCNDFSVEILNRMGQISRLAKKDGYIVSMAPAQSYLDLSTTRFSRLVNLSTFDKSWHPEFFYQGRNVYAYLLARFGDSIDFVSVQLYESYSRAAYDILHVGVRPQSYLESYVTDLVRRKNMFWVDFAKDPEVNLVSQLVSLPLDKLVIGLAGGWADNKKTLFIDPSEVLGAWEALDGSGQSPRGFMFWTIDEEGTNSVNMASGLNKALHIPQFTPEIDEKSIK